MSRRIMTTENLEEDVRIENHQPPEYRQANRVPYE